MQTIKVVFAIELQKNCVIMKAMLGDGFSNRSGRFEFAILSHSCGRHNIFGKGYIFLYSHF